MQMTKEETINRLNKYRTQFLSDMGCTILDVDLEQGICEMEFIIGKKSNTTSPSPKHSPT